MKAMVHSYVWWPKLDQNLEDMVAHACTSYQAIKQAHSAVALHT